jgi:hypothetical protein
MPDERDPVRAEVEGVRNDQAADDEDERSGNRGRREAQPEDHDQRPHADCNRRPVHVAERLKPRRELAPRTVARRRRPGELRQLADHDVDGSAGEEAGDHRLREEVRDPAEPEEREEEEQEAGGERDRRHQLRRLLARQAGDEDGAAGDGRERRARPRRDLARGAEQRVDDRARGRGVEPVL